MIKRILVTSLSCLGAGLVAQFIQRALHTDFLNNLLQEDLIQLQIALLAINSATLGVVLTKIRDLIEKNDIEKSVFQSARNEMLLSIREQVSLIVIAILVLVAWSSKNIFWSDDANLFFGSIICAVFIYSLSILYDTAKSVLEIIDF